MSQTRTMAREGGKASRGKKSKTLAYTSDDHHLLFSAVETILCIIMDTHNSFTHLTLDVGTEAAQARGFHHGGSLLLHPCSGHRVCVRVPASVLWQRQRSDVVQGGRCKGVVCMMCMMDEKTTKTHG